MTDAQTTTASSILDAAQRMTQAVGYNGLSFRDLAAAVGIKSASVHYHFPSKGLLGAAIARRYTDRLVEHLAQVEARHGDLDDAMDAYVQVFRTTLEQDGRMCLCGMLAAETDAIPDEVRAEVCRFVDANVQWLAGVFDKAAEPAASGEDSRAQAMVIFAALEGAMLVARGTGDVASFDAMAARLKRIGVIPS
jgi:TetR/AcrR family transcriptional regulator, transcriptional repressor for nem operon